ncbi:MAG: cupredoxin domain-containing protein [Bacillota bacterium]
MRRMRVGWVMLVIALLLLAGCARGEEPEVVHRPDPMAAAIAEADLAAGALRTAAEKGDARMVATAYERFALAFGKVLGPVSLKDPLVAQKMANASSAIKELLAGGKVEARAVAHHVAIIQLGLQDSVAVMASSGTGEADQAAWGRREQTIEAAGVEYRFQPAEIRVKKGTKVTIRFANKGTERHEFEIPALDFEIGPIEPGQVVSRSFTADRAGRFYYECHVDDHLEKGMRGTLIVEE